MGGSLEQADLRAVVVGVVRRLQLVDHGHDAGLAEGAQKLGDLLDRPATQVAVLGGEADVEPRFRARRDLVEGSVRSSRGSASCATPPRSDAGTWPAAWPPSSRAGPARCR
jgi:hypothetical protein